MILAAALLEILSVLPSKETVRNDETFAFTVHIRNSGPDSAQELKLRAGSNATGVIFAVDGPPEWTCEAGPRFTTATTCTAAELASGAEAEFRVTLTAPQPSAMTYRIGASLSSKGGSAKKLETNMTLVGAPSQAELSMGARKIDEEKAEFEIRNDGPRSAKFVMVVISGAALASGEGWTCMPSADGYVCTRPSMKAGTSSKIAARGKASVEMEAQVRAELNLEEKPRDNAARPR